MPLFLLQQHGDLGEVDGDFSEEDEARLGSKPLVAGGAGEGIAPRAAGSENRLQGGHGYFEVSRGPKD
jgi:hypothetical protein